jgi:hypothetical protein
MIRCVWLLVLAQNRGTNSVWRQRLPLDTGGGQGLLGVGIQQQRVA